MSSGRRKAERKYETERREYVGTGWATEEVEGEEEEEEEEEWEEEEEEEEEEDEEKKKKEKIHAKAWKEMFEEIDAL